MRKYKPENIYKGCELEQKIIDKIGNNKTKEKSFINIIPLIELNNNKTEGWAFYTYKNRVCILDNEMMDVDFSNYTQSSKEEIYNNIMKNKYK